MAEVKKITPKQRQVIELLAVGESRRNAAATAGISERTLYRWLKKDEFRQERRDYEAQLLEELQGALIARIEENLNILDGIKRNQKASDGARIRAIQLQLETMLTWRNQTITEERITAIENKIEELNL